VYNVFSFYHSNQHLFIIAGSKKTNPSFHTETAIIPPLSTAKPVNMAPLGNHSHRFTTTSPSSAHTVNPLHMLFEMVTTNVRSKQGKKRTSEIDVISLRKHPTTRGAGGVNAERRHLEARYHDFRVYCSRRSRLSWGKWQSDGKG
jgi:hypothetical protein